jgi:antirestriction protein ArdC
MTNPYRHKRRDVAKEITDTIIAALEAGAPPWKQPWAFGSASRPLRSTGAPYTGVNILILWARASAQGYENPRWLSFKQARGLGGMVRKGERSTAVVYYGATKKIVEDRHGEDSEKTIRFLKHYNVFNVAQIDGLPGHFYEFAGKDRPKTPPPSERQAFFDALKIDIRHGGDQAFYRPADDFIQMPLFGAFDDPEKYYATLAHEATHLTGHTSRLDRLKFPMSSEERAYEELVAEIGSAMLGAHLDLKPDHIENHAAYVGSWLKALRGERNFILKAAAAAQRASDWLIERAKENGYAIAGAGAGPAAFDPDEPEDAGETPAAEPSLEAA